MKIHIETERPSRVFEINGKEFTLYTDSIELASRLIGLKRQIDSLDRSVSLSWINSETPTDEDLDNANETLESLKKTQELMEGFIDAAFGQGSVNEIFGNASKSFSVLKTIINAIFKELGGNRLQTETKR